MNAGLSRPSVTLLARASCLELKGTADAAVNGRLRNSAELACSDYRFMPTDVADWVKFPARANLVQCHVIRPSGRRSYASWQAALDSIYAFVLASECVRVFEDSLFL